MEGFHKNDEYSIYCEAFSSLLPSPTVGGFGDEIEINLSSPIFGETNCRRTRGGYGEKQREALWFIIPIQFDWYTEHQSEFLRGLNRPG
jgi:hypothetical protein